MPSAATSTLTTCRRCFRRLFHAEHPRGVCWFCANAAAERFHRLRELGQLTHPTAYERHLRHAAIRRVLPFRMVPRAA